MINKLYKLSKNLRQCHYVQNSKVPNYIFGLIFYSAICMILAVGFRGTMNNINSNGAETGIEVPMAGSTELLLNRLMQCLITLYPLMKCLITLCPLSSN